MSLHHEPSVCSCSNCKSNECFVKRKTFCACPDVKSFTAKPDEELCFEAKKKNEKINVCHQSGKDISDCCKNLSVSSKLEHTQGHSDSNLTELSSSGTDRNDELIKVINETITQKLRSDVRQLLEEFRKCLIDITTKENNLKVLNGSETKKALNQCCPEDHAPSKTVTAPHETNETILSPFESQECNSQCQSIDKATKLDHLIETAKLIKLDGGVEYRHEQFIRNFGDPHKKYGEFITKDEIRTTKTYSNSKTRGQKFNKDKDDRKIESFNVNVTQKYVDNACSKLCAQETNKNSLKNTTTVNGPKHQTEQCTTCASEQVPQKSWRCMIIEDKGSDDNNKSANPSYYILEQNAFSAKPKIINVDNTWLTKHLFSNQAMVSKDHYSKENTVIVSKTLMPSLPTKHENKQTMTANRHKELKDDCLCWNTLEEYLKALSGSQIKSESEPNECCVTEKEHYVDTIKELKDEVPKKSIIDKNNNICNMSIPTDNIDLLLETLIEKQQMYRCKCSIVKTQCHKSHCCALNEDVCILEKIRAQANRVREESKQNPENIPPKTTVFCDSCKKYIPQSDKDRNQSGLDKPNYKNISHENSISTGTQPRIPSALSENVYNSCGMCGMNQNKNYQEATNNTVNDIHSEGSDPNTTSADQITPIIHITPYDILNKLKEAYKACSCKVCACVSGASKCDAPAKNISTKSAICQCDPCETSSSEKQTKSMRPNKWSLRGIVSRKQPDQMKDIIFGLGKMDESCTCLPCDCIKCLKLDINRCNCTPCECLNCDSKGGKCIEKKTITVAPVEEELRRDVCTCDPCQCASCGISMPRVGTHEVSTEMARRACDCGVCQNETCRLGGTDNCLCLSQNTIVTKPVAKNQNDYDIRTVVVQNQYPSNYGCDSCNKTSFKGPYAAFAALTDNKPHFYSTKTVSCLCKECECLACDKECCRFKHNKTEISNHNNCKCSTCECEVCPNHNTNQYVKQCQCSVCECIECETMPDSQNTVSLIPLVQHRKNSLECYGDACSCDTCVCEHCCDNCPKKNYNIKSKHLSKINFMLPRDEEASYTVLKSNTISQTSTANETENPSWSRTTNVTSNRTSMPSSCMKHIGVNDIPTKDEPNLFFDPEYDYIQDLINYKTRSLKKTLDKQSNPVPIQPISFTPAPSTNDRNTKDTNDNTKLMHLKSAKAILPRKKIFDAGTPSVIHRVEKVNYSVNKKKSSSSSPRKSSLNLLVNSDDPSENNYGGKWIKESDFVLRRCETKASNFAGNYIKGNNIQYVKTSDVLINAKRFSLSLLKILEKYEKANQEFQSVTATTQYLKKQNSIKHEMIEGFAGYLHNFSILYQNKSDLNVNTMESQSCALDFKESQTKGGFVLDMRRQNTYENVTSIATVTENRETFDICRYIIVMLINSLSTAKRPNFKPLSKVRTVLNLPNKNNNLTKTIEKTNTEHVIKSKYDLQNKNKEKNGLQIMSSRSLIQNKSSRNANIALETVKRSTYHLDSEGQHVEIYDDSKQAETSVSQSFQVYDSKSPKLENSKISSSAEDSEEVEVTVCVSTADMNSLRSMEGNYVYVINNNRHPIREYLDDPSLHILKKNTRLDEVLYPKLSPAYPSMQYDIKNTLHMTRHDPSETGPSSTRHLLHTMMKNASEQKVVETTSQITSKDIANTEDSSFPENTLNFKIEDEKSGGSLHEQLTATPVKTSVDKELSCHRTCDTKSSSFEALKAHFQGVTRISNHTAIIKWNKPKSLDGVCGYELLIDGVPVKTDLSPSRCMAVVTCIPQSETILLTIRTIVAQTGGVKRCPTSTTEYHPRINS